MELYKSFRWGLPWLSPPRLWAPPSAHEVPVAVREHEAFVKLSRDDNLRHPCCLLVGSLAVLVNGR
jgi:hypothetical protein